MGGDAGARARSYEPPANHGIIGVFGTWTVVAHQKTISREVAFTGRGLFSGETATLSFAPAPPDAGITFVREQDGKVASMGNDSLSVAIGTVEFHLRVAPDGRVLGGRIPAQNLVVDRIGGS